MRCLWTCLTLATVGASLVCTPASAKDAAKTPPQALPGVAGGYSIVKPLPEPDEEPAQAGNGSHFKVGDIDVRVSGSITVDVGAGSIRPPQH